MKAARRIYVYYHNPHNTDDGLMKTVFVFFVNYITFLSVPFVCVFAFLLPYPLLQLYQLMYH